MSESNVKKEKQKKSLRKIVGKLYKKDLEEILVKFFQPKKGSKDVLKTRVLEMIETDKQDIDFDKIRKEIRKVYKSNPKIRKTPKKAKSSPKKSPSKASASEETLIKIRNILNECVNDREEEDDYESDERDSNEMLSFDFLDESPSPLMAPQMPAFNPLTHSNQQTVNPNNYDNNPIFYDINSNQRFQSTVNPTDIQSFEALNQSSNGQTIQQSIAQPFAANTINTNMSFPSAPQLFPIFSNTINQSQRTHNFPFSGVAAHVPPPTPMVALPNQQNMSHTHNTVHNSQLIRPITNSYNGSTQPLNYSINNYIQSSSQNYFYQNPNTEVLNPENFASLVEQQKFLLSQYCPKSLQESDKSSNESDVPFTDFAFKALPKYNVFKILKETKTIGSLSDIGTEIDFKIKASDLEPNYFEKNYLNENLQNLLERKSMKIQLRFTYVSNIQTKEQRDSIPEYLCIECNNQNIYTYEENSENTSGPFDLSQYCNYNDNKIKFWMSKQNYTFLLPCIYEITIVEFNTCDTFLLKLKENFFQFLTSDSTKQLIKSRSEQLSHDEIISINTETKLKLICPLSCRRIQTPCRTVDCKHIECFDAYSFFKTNETRYEWFCPICQKSAQFERLRIDGYLTEILNSTEININEIFIKTDGSYDVIQTNKETEIIELDDSLADSDIEFSVVDADGCIVLD